jgi:hypothetical protein
MQVLGGHRPGPPAQRGEHQDAGPGDAKTDRAEQLRGPRSRRGVVERPPIEPIALARSMLDATVVASEGDLGHTTHPLLLMVFILL